MTIKKMGPLEAALKKLKSAKRKLSDLNIKNNILEAEKEKLTIHLGLIHDGDVDSIISEIDEICGKANTADTNRRVAELRAEDAEEKIHFVGQALGVDPDLFITEITRLKTIDDRHRRLLSLLHTSFDEQTNRALQLLSSFERIKQ